MFYRNAPRKLFLFKLSSTDKVGTLSSLKYVYIPDSKFFDGFHVSNP